MARKIIVIMLCVLLIGVPALAQGDPDRIQVDTVQVDADMFPQVTAYTTVRNPNGVPILNLDGASFQVDEDGAGVWRAPTGVESVIDDDLRISILLVFDLSGSMQGQPLADAKQSAIAFLDFLNPQDRVALIAFRDQIDLGDPLRFVPPDEHPFTPLDASGKRYLADAIAQLEASGNTPLYDAVFKAVHLAKEEDWGHRAVIIFTDGCEQRAGGACGSGPSVMGSGDAIDAAHQHKVPIFTIGLGQSENMDARYLERLALATVGDPSGYQASPDAGQLGELFKNVARRLKQQYAIRYESALDRDGKAHRLAVRLREQQSIVADAEFSLPADSDQSANAPTPTAAPPTATPPSTATPAPTHTPLPLPTETTALPTVTPPVPTSTPTPGTGNRVGLLAGVGGGVLASIAVAVILVLRGRRKSPQTILRCKNCGRELGPGEVCPDCGPKGVFEETR